MQPLDEAWQKTLGNEREYCTLDPPDSCQIWPEVFVTSTGQSDTSHTVALGPGVTCLPH